jgi:1-acyl-sn-glycerol-3-phosphate acyltransferase
VFPEGKRTPDGRIQTFRPGVGYMASRLNLNVVPIRLDGSFAVFPTGARWPRRGAVRVHIGRPLAPGPHESDADFARRVEDAARTLGAQG